MKDLKPVYKAVNREAAELALDELEKKWGAKYPIVIKSWRNKWENLAVYFKYPPRYSARHLHDQRHRGCASAI